MPAKQHWNFVLAGIGIIGTLVTVVTVTDPKVRKYGLWSLAACVVWGVVSSLYYAVRSKKPMTVSIAHTEDEVEAAWQLGNTTYSRMKKHYPSDTLVKSWWRQYPLGVWICRDGNDEIWGYFSIWPIREETFQKLKNGTLLEDDIASKDLRSEDTGPHTYWYIADICGQKGLPIIRRKLLNIWSIVWFQQLFELW